MPEIHAILFDMDGVLVNAKEWHFEALNNALISHGYQPISRQDHLTRFDGLPTRKKLALLAQTQSIPESEFEAINADKQRMTTEIAQAKCLPTQAHLDMVQRLQIDGYPMAVCSNSVRASVDLLLEKTCLMPFFAFTLSNEDVKRPKPAPDIYQLAMQRLSVSPLHTLILEDNVHGIEAARASGAHVMEIKDISEVNYDNVMRAIKDIGKIAV